MQNSTVLMLLADILPAPPTGTMASLAQNGLNFFSTWIARMGGIIAFVGALKFALSVKNDDAKEQLQSLLIMVSGFMIVSAVRDLSIFSTTVGDVDQQFAEILGFIVKWTRRVGAFALLIGSIMFGLAIKENNASTKVTSLKTITAGAMVIAVSALLPTLAYM